MSRVEVEYLEQLPPVLHDVIEVRAFSVAEQPLLESLWKNLYQSIDNNFVLTADDAGLKHYERMLDLRALASDSIETRRLQVMSRIQEQAPYTWKVLNRILTNLLGAGNFTVARNVATKILTVRLELTNARQYDILVATLERIVPQDMVLDISLRFNTQAVLSQFTHAQLAAYTQEQLRSSVLT